MCVCVTVSVQMTTTRCYYAPVSGPAPAPVAEPVVVPVRCDNRAIGDWPEPSLKGSVFSERIPENHQPSSSLPMTYGNVPRVVLALIHDECVDTELYNAQNNTHTSQ